METSLAPAEAIAALLKEDGLPDEVRQTLAQSDTYDEQCLAIHGLGNRLSPEFIQSFNSKHGTLLSTAGVTAVQYLTKKGLIPPVHEGESYR